MLEAGHFEIECWLGVFITSKSLLYYQPEPATPLPVRVASLTLNGVSHALRLVAENLAFHSLATLSGLKRVTECSHRMENVNLQQAIPPCDEFVRMTIYVWLLSLFFSLFLEGIFVKTRSL